MSNQKQFVNIIKSYQNIKIDYQILQNNEIKESSQSVFLLQDNLFSSDTLFKLQALEDTIKKTYISAICESKEQKIIDKNDLKEKNATYIPFDSGHLIELNNTTIETSTLFNNNGNIDYLFSPFNLLQSYLSENLEANSLNMLIHNDNIYTIILSQDKRYVDSYIVSLTPFNDIKNSEFYKDEVVEQKLYDEIYLLELTDQISNIIKEYYQKFNNTNFIEKINLFYTVKQLDDQHLQTIRDELMLDLEYTQIQLDLLMFDMAKKNNATKYSFIEPRSKKVSLDTKTWSLIAVSSLCVVFLALYLLSPNGEIKEEVQSKTLEKIENKTTNDTAEKTKKIIKEIKLTDHVIFNTNLVAFIKELFNTIDDETLLKEIQIQKNESTMICNFATPSAQEKFLNYYILKLYEKSEVILMNNNDTQLTTIISNNKPINSIEKNKISYNIGNKFLTKEEGKNYLQNLLGNDVKVLFENEINESYSQQIFTITAIIKEPVHFYKIVDVINKQNYSIVLDYPIEFVKTNKNLEVTFGVLLNQSKQF